MIDNRVNNIKIFFSVRDQNQPTEVAENSKKVPSNSSRDPIETNSMSQLDHFH